MTQARTPKGTPSGGQFSGTDHTESDVSLESATRTVDDGTETWRDNDGLVHRDDGPAVTYSNGGEIWYQHGKLHRDGGPAVTYSNGSESWWHHGKEVDPPR